MPPVLRRNPTTPSELLLYDIWEKLTVTGGSGPSATEATLQLVLSAIQNGSEFEAKLVEDAVNVTWLEVRTWNTESGTWNPPLYYPPGSNTPGTPTAPITYINPSALLSTIANNTTDNATETTLQAIEAWQSSINLLLTLIEGETANLDVALSTRASETTLSAVATSVDAIDSVNQDILFAVENIDINTTPSVRAPLLLRGALSGTYPAGARRLSFANYHASVSGTVQGVAINPGESITLVAGGENDTLSPVNYAFAGGDVLITAIT